MPGSRPSTADKRKTFRKLHEAGCFVIPNPWNVGSARYLQGLGFKALATTSAGHAHAQGFADGAQSRDDVLAHYRELAAATDVPLNADFENGFADDPAGVADSVTRCIETGVAGLSIEDSPNNSATPLYDFDLSVARVKAARAAVDRAGGDVVFTARAENFIRGVPDLDDAIRRLKAYAAAGADCLYAPGIKTREADRGGGQSGGAEAGELPQQRRVRLHGRRHCGDGRAPHQRRRLAGPRGDARLHPRRHRDRQGRQVRRLRRADFQSRAEQVLQRGSQEIFVMTGSEPHPQTGQPVGLPVDPTPAPRPGPVTLKGRYGRLEKLKPAHAPDLWTAFAGHDQVWTYISTDGPFASAAEFVPFIARRAAANDPYAYAIVDTSDRAVGYLTLLRIEPDMRVIEVGHVLYSPALQRTPLGTETQYLLARYVFETLGYRRYEWKCNALNAPSWRAALRYGFSLRRDVPPAHHRQGPQPR